MLRTDVVLTSFSTVQDLQRGSKKIKSRIYCGVLRRVHWLRIVVDEVQFVRNDTSQIAKAMHTLSCTHIWMLSGTPFTKKIDEMQGVLSLLRLWPFALSKGADKKGGWTNWFWVQEVKEKWERKDASVLRTLLGLLQGVMMRHSRFQCYIEEDGDRREGLGIDNSNTTSSSGSSAVARATFPRTLKPLVPLPPSTVHYVGLSIPRGSSEGGCS